jgi:hypothetical protein
MEVSGEQHISISFSELDAFFDFTYGNNINKIVIRSKHLIRDKSIMISFLKHHLEDFMPAGPKCSCAQEEKAVENRCKPLKVFKNWIFPRYILQCPLIEYTLAEIIKYHVEISMNTFEELVAIIPAHLRDEVIRVYNEGHLIPSTHVALMEYPMDSEIAASEVN